MAAPTRYSPDMEQVEPDETDRRARNERYRLSAEFRGPVNGCSMHEPRSAGELELAS